jgi:prophage antirepressor-like protein
MEMKEELNIELREIRKELRELRKSFDVVMNQGMERLLTTADVCRLLDIKPSSLTYRINNSKKLREDEHFTFHKGRYGFKAIAVYILKEEYS